MQRERQLRMDRLRACAAVLLITAFAVGAMTASAMAAAAPAFQKWLEGLWPQAQALGVSRKTFEAATRGVTPDLTLPDLDLPGQIGTPPKGQAEFVQTPADYIKE